MSKTLKSIAALIIVLFAVVMCALVGWAMYQRQSPEQTFRTGGVVNAARSLDEANLVWGQFMAMDLYGEEFTEAIAVCPRETAASVQEKLQLPSMPEGIDSEVGIDENYLLLIRSQDGSSVADKFHRNEVDFCSQRFPVVGHGPTDPITLTKVQGTDPEHPEAYHWLAI